MALLLGSLVASLATAAEPSPEALDFFEKEVRPLLASRCFECHGPGEKIKGGLRLDSRTAILAGGETGPAAEPGKPDASLLIEAVKYQGFEMPPKGKMPEAEIATLARWIEMGLPWPAGEAATDVEPHEELEFTISDTQRSHWSFQPLRQIAPRPVKQTSWPVGPIDQFILAGLESRDLGPNAPASRHALLRRVTFDLTGLPPTLAETQEFLADDSPAALEKMVDRLLASTHYGERWGRHWLDVVRYADTAGETADFPVPEAYQYRNYVIDAFNHDKPYDEFVREQIAGDLLAAEGPAEKYAERITATGYLAISRRFGFDPQNYNHLTIADTIDTLGRSMLGLSIGCARCHDHKYDPLSAKDYYALYGIFASSRYAFPGSEEKRVPRDFVPLLPSAQAQKLLAARQSELAPLDAEIKRLEALPKEPAEVEAQLAAQVGPDGDFEAQGLDVPVAAPWVVGGKVISLADAQSPLKAGTRGARFANDGENNSILQKFDPRTSASAGALYLSLDFRNVSVSSGGAGTYRFCFSHGPGTSTGVEIYVDGAAIFLRNGDEIERLQELHLGEWNNLQLAVDLAGKTYGGAVTSRSHHVSFSGKKLRPAWDGTIDSFFVDCYGFQPGVKPAHDVDNLAIGDAPQAGQPSAADANLSQPDPELVKKQSQLADLRTQRQILATLKAQHAKLSAVAPFAVAYGVVEGTPVNARIQKRGEPTRLGAEVPRRFLQVLGGDTLGPSAGSGRLELAQWITRPGNPLTARVIVNRIWHYHFGKGLVATTNDFGLRGRKPTHPDLLDYLAGRLLAQGWSLKAMHKEIVLSSAYQMSSAVNPRGLEIDPNNELLWRFDRQRLDAESIRDAVLAISGELDTSVGGPHPFPPVGSWAFTQHAPFKAVYDSRQRSVYLMTQRSQRHPFLALFDGADPNASTSERTSTTTPTQALFMMNDPFVHERSVALGRRLLTERSDDADRLELLYELAIARPPHDDEGREGREFLARYAAALQTANVPADQHSLLAWAALARVLITSNEFLYLD